MVELVILFMNYNVYTLKNQLNDLKTRIKKLEYKGNK